MCEIVPSDLWCIQTLMGHRVTDSPQIFHRLHRFILFIVFKRLHLWLEFIGATFKFCLMQKKWLADGAHSQYRCERSGTPSGARMAGSPHYQILMFVP